MTAGAWADDVITATSTSGTVKYVDLRAAIAGIRAASKDVVLKFTGDDTTSFATSDKLVLLIENTSVDFTIDGDGRTLRGITDASAKHALILSGDKNVTIKNLTFDKFGDTSAVNMQINPIWLSLSFKNSTLTLDNVTIKNFNRSAINANAGKLILNDCIILGNSAGTYQSFQDGIQILSADVTIKGNTSIKGIHGDGTWDAGCVELTFGVDTGTFVQTKGKLTIESGTFEGMYGVIVANGSTTKNTYAINTGAVTITGGTFKGTQDVDILMEDIGTEAIKVSGGKFSKKVPADYLASGATIAKNGDWWVVSSGSSTTTPKEITATVSNGELKVTVTPSGSTATLEEVLNKVSAEDKAKITTLKLDNQISSLTASDLASLTGLKSLAVDSGSSVSTVDLSSNTTITEFKAPNASKLTSLSVKGNKTIQTLDVSGSGLTTLDASNCSALKTVSAKGGKLESVNFTGTKLTDLNVSGNKLTQLDLTGQTLAASKANFGGQATTKSYTLAKEMDFAQLMGLSSLKARIKAIYEILNGIEIQSGYYDPDDGTVTFDETPKNSLKYYYDTGVTISSSSNKADEASLAAGESAAYMDVTVSGGTAAEEKEEEEATTASSSSGCEAGLGLGALAALAIFAKKR